MVLVYTLDYTIEYKNTHSALTSIVNDSLPINVQSIAEKVFVSFILSN